MRAAISSRPEGVPQRSSTGTVVGVVILLLLILAGGAYWAIRSGMLDRTPKPVPTTATPAPVPTHAATTEAAPTAPSEPVPPPTAAAPTATTSAATPAVSAPADATKLSFDQGILIIDAKEPAAVFINGVRLGNTGEPIQTSCGAKFVRLAKTDSKPDLPTWLTAGQSVTIGCRRTTKISLPLSSSPSPPPPPSPSPSP
jgi:hypothetical protein